MSRARGRVGVAKFRPGSFVNLCYRLEVDNIPANVQPLSKQDRARLWKQVKRAGADQSSSVLELMIIAYLLIIPTCRTFFSASNDIAHSLGRCVDVPHCSDGRRPSTARRLGPANSGAAAKCAVGLSSTPLREIRVMFETVNPVPNSAASYNAAPTDTKQSGL
jgi:hypothetical protein